MYDRFVCRTIINLYSDYYGKFGFKIQQIYIIKGNIAEEIRSEVHPPCCE